LPTNRDGRNRNSTATREKGAELLASGLILGQTSALLMAKEFFAHQETRQLFNTLEDISRRSKVSRAQAFEDVIRASVAALAAETMEPEYFEAINAHTAGVKGKRGVDLFPVFLGQAVDAMTRTDNDVLGDLFQGAISYGEHGLYLTPSPVAKLMASMMVGDEPQSIDKQPMMISDPLCGVPHKGSSVAQTVMWR